MADVEGAKKRLVEALKDKTQRYWDLIKNWYKRRISKDDFDTKARSLLGEGNLHLHNEFLFAILVKCQTGAHPDVQPSAVTPHKPKPKRPKLGPSTETIPYGALDPLQYYPPPMVQIVGRDLDNLLLCSHELLLPGLPTLHTRMLLGAWEAGLEGVAEEAAQLLMFALEYHLKTVIQALIAHRSSWRLRYGNFQHSFGSGLTSRALPSTSMPGSGQGGTYRGDTTEAETALVAAQSTPARQLEPLNLFHLRDTLRVNRHCIPVHSVYACNVERVLAAMWHPSQEEEEQRRTVEEWRNSLEPSIPFTISTSHYTKR